MKKKDWEKIFKEHGLKVTKGRVLVARELEVSSQPISAEQVYKALIEKGEKIDLSTIYRTLETLAQKKIVKKISFAGDDKNLYDVETDKHCHYLICKECQKILSISHCPIENYEEKLKEETGFEIEEHSLYLYGTCKDCSKKEK